MNVGFVDASGIWNLIIKFIQKKGFEHNCPECGAQQLRSFGRLYKYDNKVNEFIPLEFLDSWYRKL